ncbi:glutathione S-transferase family protein (plasmid) [Nostoc sp. UHCC 0926]|uniref:glutathione S-transferase family protein n=1 Tax=Nostocales TaxID=1161 RepID=UPI000B5C2946|nr:MULTISPECIES: glutathione S-transferase family protein [Nostocales]MBD2731450.1 glutathione S-transferase family protein [Nostoc sp. FACHB-892]MCW5313106.1 glutathione S-transferase family protein [Nostoc sp. KVJ3]MDZ8084310.1 glutathione S-transferase family protein [Nostoc sp. DedQUE12b]WDD36305.1 glutathione S-transferase family protein [Nostoc sp. UHCC 0926]GAX46126.1 glutathione S-transferase domain-containing protein [Tolypothrix sp. NIES-4075]
MKLYEFAPTRSIRVRWVLQELGVEFEAISINMQAGEHRTPDFLTINPTGKLPVLIDGEHIITESVAIALYLGEKYPESNLVPTDLLLRAQLYRWLLFTATELEQPLWRIARHTFIYPEELRLPAEIPLARQDFTSMAVVLENHLLDRQFVVGEHVTVADFVLAYTLDWANEVQLLATFPTLVDYMERMYKRPKASGRIAAALASLNQTSQ